MDSRSRDVSRTLCGVARRTSGDHCKLTRLPRNSCFQRFVEKATPLVKRSNISPTILGASSARSWLEYGYGLSKTFLSFSSISSQGSPQIPPFSPAHPAKCGCQALGIEVLVHFGASVWRPHHHPAKIEEKEHPQVYDTIEKVRFNIIDLWLIVIKYDWIMIDEYIMINCDSLWLWVMHWSQFAHLRLLRDYGTSKSVWGLIP